MVTPLATDTAKASIDSPRAITMIEKRLKKPSERNRIKKYELKIKNEKLSAQPSPAFVRRKA